MENYFLSLPNEIMLDLILYFDTSTLCNFIMSSKEFKQICDTNEIWKRQYLRTNPGSWTIRENSIHIGGITSHNVRYEYEIYDKEKNETKKIFSRTKPTGKTNLLIKSSMPPEKLQKYDCYFSRCRRLEKECVKKIYIDFKFIRTIGCIPYLDNYENNWSYNLSVKNMLVSYGIENNCLSCQRKQILKAGFMYKKPRDMNVIDWQTDIYKKWKAFNEKNNLHHLCQNPLHYDIDTLEPPKSCRNFKCYKKMIIKKLLTQNKKDNVVHKNTTKKRRTLKTIEKIEQRLLYEKAKIETFDKNIKCETEKTNKLKEALKYGMNVSAHRSKCL